ncbi:hypothetical protein ABGT15_13805 [Flavobacterium enshiense]|uniref:hypothetical protein n=1 Tax=Flavobacterium enshiense TaxID=1341165 RepID=UPI00345D8354
MRKKFYYYIFLLFVQLSFSQNVNFIIQVNEKLAEQGRIANLYVKFSTENQSKKYYVNYYPGDLILNEEVWSLINSPSIDKFYLHFDFYTYTKESQKIKSFDMEINKKLLEQPYLIANIYDFRDKKYKRWYQWHTKESYIVEFKHPQSGILVRAN